MYNILTTALIASIVTSVIAIIGWIGNRWFNSQDKNQDLIRDDFKNIDNNVEDMGKVIDKTKEDFNAKISSLNSTLYQIEKNQGRNFERINIIDRSVSERFNSCPYKDRITTINNRLTKLDGDDKYGEGHIAVIETNIKRLEKIMNIEKDVHDISEQLKAINIKMEAYNDSLHELKEDISIKYVSKETYRRDMDTLNKSINSLVKILKHKFQLGAGTELMMTIPNDDKD